MGANLTIYIFGTISFIILLIMGIYITYQQETTIATYLFDNSDDQGKLRKLVAAGRRTLSNLKLEPSSHSLVALGQTIKRLTREKLADNNDGDRDIIKTS